MIQADLNRVNDLVLHKQHLTADSKIHDIIETVEDVGGLHATSPATPYLSLFARMRNFEKESLDEELHMKRNLGKIRCMRGTLYVLTKEMIPIAYAATRKKLEAATKKYAEFRGVSQEKYREVSRSIMRILAGKEMSASEIRKKLKTRLDVSATLYLMCDQGLLVRTKPDKYALFREYFPRMNLAGISEAEARTSLVRHYLSSFGPATENDIAWWSGRGTRAVRKELDKLQGEIVVVGISDLSGDFVTLKTDENVLRRMKPPPRRTVNFLPSLDPYLMGYKGRQRYISREHYDKVFDRSGNATSTILVDGRVVGVWDLERDRESSVKIFLFEEPERNLLREIYLEAQEIGTFMTGKEVQITECDSMVPLTRRTAGAVMSPLRGCQC